MTAPDKAYLTVAEARAFARARAITGLENSADDTLGAALLRASEWLDTSFSFRGRPAAAGQLRAFPRIGLGGDYDPDSPVLPPAVLQATVELAAALLVSEAEAEQLLGLRGAVAREQVGDVVVSWRARRGAQGRLAHLLRGCLHGGQQGQSGAIGLRRS